MDLTTDKVTTITGLIMVIAASIAAFLPPDIGELVKQIAQGVAAIAGAICVYFINKGGTVKHSYSIGVQQSRKETE